LFHDTPVWIAGVVVTVLLVAWATERMIERPGTEFGRRLSLRLRPRVPAAPRAA
jgi:peptidoglycan/LPS O-acetylase OafA/YrhL